MAANTTDVILNIRTFDSHSEPVKEHSCVTVPKEAQDKTLSELRKKLVDAKVLDSKVYVVKTQILPCLIYYARLLCGC